VSVSSQNVRCTNAGKAHQLEEGRDMLLIATDAIERLSARRPAVFNSLGGDGSRPICHGPYMLRRVSDEYRA
jgi:hypothetical protein